MALGLAVSGCDAGIADAEASVRDRLSDPASAEFQDVKRCPSDENVIIGDVNSKNAYGGYTGFRPFLYRDGVAVFSDDTERFEARSLECFGSAP